MPPKPKNTKEEIAAAAFVMIKESGIEALTARELGKRLNSSAGSIFTVYNSMDDVKMAARALAIAEMIVYIKGEKTHELLMNKAAQIMISYGNNEPEMFKLIFLQDTGRKKKYQDNINEYGSLYRESITQVCQHYVLTDEEGQYLFEQMWIYAYGLGTMCALGLQSINDMEIEQRVRIFFSGMISFIRKAHENT